MITNTTPSPENNPLNGIDLKLAVVAVVEELVKQADCVSLKKKPSFAQVAASPKESPAACAVGTIDS